MKLELGKMRGLNLSKNIATARDLGRPKLFLLTLIVAYIAPALIDLEVSLTFSFAIMLTLAIWLSFKWPDFLKLNSKSRTVEVLVGSSALILNFTRNIINGEMFGITDILITFVALYIAFFGIKATRFFAPPLLYILILIAGYQIEFAFPQIKALESWLANGMTGVMQIVGANTQTDGNTVTIYGREIYALKIDGPCTGIKGVTAYGALAAILVVDTKASLRRKAVVVALGFVGTFLTNLLRLAVIFLSSYSLGVDTALTIHTYLGYSLFMIWVIAFWSISFRHLLPAASHLAENPNSRLP